MDVSHPLHELELCMQLLSSTSRDRSQGKVEISPGHEGKKQSLRDVRKRQAQLYLHSHLFQKCLESTEKLLEEDPLYDFGLQQLKVRSLFGLGRYRDAMIYLTQVDKLLKAEPLISLENQRHLQKIANLTNEAKELAHIQKTAEYDMTRFLPNRKMRYAQEPEFQGPLRVVQIQGKGRGMVATRDIKAGELVSASRAFEIVFDEGDDEEILEQLVFRKLSLDPENQLQEVYQLFAGKTLGHIPSKDKLPKKSTTLGTFPAKWKNCDDTLKNNDNKEPDLHRIRGICSMNSFGNSRNFSGYGHDSRGIWGVASFFNHDCIDFNCLWKVLGDFLFVRACKPIKKGQELLISYTDSTEIYEERLKFFEAHDFVCCCRLCKYQGLEELAVRQKRIEILDELDKIDTNSKPLVDKNITLVESRVKELKELGTYQGTNSRPEWNFCVHNALDILCKLLITKNDTKYTQVAEEYYDVVNGRAGLSKSCLEIGAAGQVASVFLRANDLKGAEKWITVLKEDLSLIYGNANVFKIIYPVLYSEAKKRGIKVD